jgi:pimeloyl-ACP methyl ester carboxylesterase
MNDGLRFNTGEVELAYTEWPGDGPPVVALSGISGRRAAHLARWEDGHHAFAYDHRGHGDSGRTPGTYSFVNYGRDCVAFLRGVVREPAILVGHSLGGMTAIYAAAQAPELVKAAFLVDPPLYAPEQPLRDEAGPFAAVEQQAGLPLADLLATGMEPYRAEAITRLDPGVMNAVNTQSGFEGWDTDALLDAIRCHVVLEHGDRDIEGMASVIHEGELERALSHLKDVRVLHMPGTGHAPWMSAGAEFYAELSKFIAEQRGADPSA